MKSVCCDWQWSPMSIQNVVNVKTKQTPRCIYNTGNTRSYQLGIKFTGYSELRYRGYSIDFSPATVAYLPKENTKDIDYTTVTSKAGNGVCIFFDSELPLPNEPQILKSADAEIENAFLRVFHIYSRMDQYGYPALMEAFYSLLAKLNQKINPLCTHMMNEQRFLPALEHIQRHCMDSYIDTKHVAELCGMSEKYFRDSFKQTFQKSPLQYFHEEKSKHIQTLISDLSFSVSEISRMSGFSDPNYFSRFFRKYFGVSPTE